MLKSVTRSFMALLLFLALYLSALPASYAAGLDHGDNASPVTVSFLCDEDQLLSCLTVFDINGEICPPLKVPESDEPSYGNFLLAPGTYSYRFYDNVGRYEELEESFTVVSALAQYLYLDLIPAREIYSFSYTSINPLYADVIQESDIPEIPISEEERTEQLLAFAESLNGSYSRRNAKYYRDTGVYYTDVASAAEDLKSQIMSFEELAVIRLVVDSKPSSSDWQSLCATVFSTAIAHTGRPTEGDYLRYEYGGYNAGGSIEYSGGRYVCLFNYTLLHYTTAEQEEELTSVVNDILSDLALDGKDDYEKLQAIYGYLCDNVKYGGSDKVRFTAYAALINKRAVCQGYSTAFYRLCLEAGIDTRIISCVNMNHAWSIAELDGQYYAFDATWDTGAAPDNYRFFLRGSIYWLESHKTNGISEIGDEYGNEEFAARYTISVNDDPRITPLFTVSFDSNGGSATEAQTVAYGRKASQPISPVRDNYYFAGWFTDSGLLSGFDFEGTLITADLTLYAKWVVPDLILPDSTTIIEEEAFAGGAFTFVKLPDRITTISQHAFADCPKLSYVYIPSGIGLIDPKAFAGSDSLTILGEDGSASEEYARTYGFSFIALS